MKAERLARLQRLLERQQRAFTERCVGRTLPVLFEKAGRRAGQLDRPLALPAVGARGGPADLLGQIVPVEISAFGPNSLAGVIRPAVTALVTLSLRPAWLDVRAGGALC